jgi:hypothetical protein
MRISDALGDHPGLDIAGINVPTFMLAVFGAAAEKLGHAGIEAQRSPQGNPDDRQRGLVGRSIAVPAITVASTAAVMGIRSGDVSVRLSTLSSEHLGEIRNRAAHLVAFQIEEGVDQARAVRCK